MTDAKEIQQTMREAIAKAVKDKAAQVLLDWEAPAPGRPFFIVSVYARPVYKLHIKAGNFSEVYEALTDLFYIECPASLEPQHREYTPRHAVAKTTLLISRLDVLTKESTKERFGTDYRRRTPKGR